MRHALAQTQLAYLKEVISSQHVFLEDDQSLEVLLVQGPAERLQQLCDDLRKIRGVQQIKLVATTALLPPLHAHGAPSRRASRPRRSFAVNEPSTADPGGARAHARAMARHAGVRPCRPPGQRSGRPAAGRRRRARDLGRDHRRPAATRRGSWAAARGCG